MDPKTLTRFSHTGVRVVEKPPAIGTHKGAPAYELSAAFAASFSHRSVAFLAGRPSRREAHPPKFACGELGRPRPRPGASPRSRRPPDRTRGLEASITGEFECEVILVYPDLAAIFARHIDSLAQVVGLAAGIAPSF